MRVIDVHVHLFNALDIPIEGYLVSRRSERSRGLNLEYLLGFVPGPPIFTYVAERMRERCVKKELGRDIRGSIYRLLLWLFGRSPRQQLGEWEATLTEPWPAIVTEALETWPRTDLLIDLMLDYEYWFKNSYDRSVEQQVSGRLDAATRPSGGRVHAFAPFDPAREIAFHKGMNGPDGQKECQSSIELVKRAIEREGFLGVKVYNSLGYRPLGNDDPRCTLYRTRVAVRNDKLHYLFDGSDYDGVLQQLYAYCEANEVPITAHCGMTGIEAYPKASFHFGAPRFWEPVLNAYPRLRLNLAHFGWAQEAGRGFEPETSWVRTICDMMVRHEHLYADVSHHPFTSACMRRRLIRGYREMRNSYAGDRIEKIRKRILYGSDWHVVKRTRRYRDFLDRSCEVMRRSGMYDESSMQDFLARNATGFLGLNAGGRNRERLERFYREQSIEPPDWFVETGTW